jgi:ABC-type enterochelin transport system substrate-binding protein
LIQSARQATAELGQIFEAEAERRRQSADVAMDTAPVNA